MAGFGVWDMFSRMGLPVFTPEAPDLALGKLLRSSWYSLAVNGSLPVGGPWAAVDDADFPAHYQVFPLNISSQSVEDFKKDECAQLATWGFDQQFWWIN